MTDALADVRRDVVDVIGAVGLVVRVLERLGYEDLRHVGEASPGVHAVDGPDVVAVVAHGLQVTDEMIRELVEAAGDRAAWGFTDAGYERDALRYARREATVLLCRYDQRGRITAETETTRLMIDTLLALDDLTDAQAALMQRYRAAADRFDAGAVRGGRRSPRALVQRVQELVDGLPRRILETDAADGETTGEPSPALRRIEEDLSELERLIAELGGRAT